MCLFGSSSCYNHEKDESEIRHPEWWVCNEDEDDEDKVPKDKCIITKCDFGKLRFHVTDHQQCLNAEVCPKSEKNIVDFKATDNKEGYWVLTPNFYGRVTLEKFPKTLPLIKHKYNDKEGGMPAEFLEELLAIDDHKGAILIISTGLEEHLGVSQKLRDALKNKLKEGDIQGYKERNTYQAIKLHNRYVKEGKKVFTFIYISS
ncbi:hypothetical protein [Candidatus Cardinium hertigii]|uniref:hypothetical protein n=1 Tax=Candidatus Cardinium hertigii TaxID=247481 RepID=UPI000F4B996D|nr:hypothetical protein [Candidatus Cardinium hertigii]